VTGGSQAQRLSRELGVQPWRLGGAWPYAQGVLSSLDYRGPKVGGWVSVPWVRIGTTGWFG